MNELGELKTPFLFIIDFDMEKPIVLPLSKVDANNLLFSVNGVNNVINSDLYVEEFSKIKYTPVSKIKYTEAFNHVQKHIKHGNSFLVNLTMPTKISSKFNLKDVFFNSKAKYKLWIKNEIVVFSPETFVKTKGRKISAFPMKGTMDASIPNAKHKLLNSEKELAEHYTIVDLIRNDLSMVAKNVNVEKFRFIEHIKTNNGGLLQMSSEICGELPENYHEKIGDIIFKMLPAGSITGAPKLKTLEIIKDAEKYKRGYYTGIFGIFDGENIDSGVMIRYIEQTANGLVYKSGGGITVKSDVEEEYKELINKIYIPV